MKTIGLLGGTGWSSTINYYKLLNEYIHDRLGGSHSAKIILKSIDYHEIATNYGKNNKLVSELLKEELKQLIELKPDCIIICCNSLHKFYDMIKDDLNNYTPVLHAVELVAQYAKKQKYNKVLLLATKLTMEDSFFTKKLESNGIEVVIPNQSQRNDINNIIFNELINNKITEQSKDYFVNLVKQYADLDAVVLGCTELPLVLDESTSVLPIIDPVKLQTKSAVDFALQK